MDFPARSGSPVLSAVRVWEIDKIVEIQYYHAAKLAICLFARCIEIESEFGILLKIFAYD